LINDSKLLVFGGHDGTNMLNDINILDIPTMNWTVPTIAIKNADGSPALNPSARAGHTATIVAKKLLVFGGGDGSKILNDTWVLDLAIFNWSRPTVSGTAPAGRCAHTATLLDSALIVFGGGDGGRRFKDLYILDIDQLMKTDDAKRTKVKKAKKSDSLKGDIKFKDISAWLANIGMKKYAEKFTAQEIDMDTLPYLTETHLEQLGVAPLGSRLRIVAAIKSLQQDSEEETKEKDLTDYTQTLKESIDNLTTTTNLYRMYLKQCLVKEFLIVSCQINNLFNYRLFQHQTQHPITLLHRRLRFSNQFRVTVPMFTSMEMKKKQST